MVTLGVYHKKKKYGNIFIVKNTFAKKKTTVEILWQLCNVLVENSSSMTTQFVITCWSDWLWVVNSHFYMNS